MRWFLALMALMALVLIGVGFMAWHGRPQSVITDTHAPEIAVMIPESRTPPPGMKEFRNSQYRFSLFIPESMNATSTDEGQGAATFVFEDRATGTGFQLFIVPFIEKEVSEERFRMDIPSGVRNDMKDITIDGAVGASFFSEHAALGETAEVWFVANGYLYEVTTIKSLSDLVSELMASWKFLE